MKKDCYHWRFWAHPGLPTSGPPRIRCIETWAFGSCQSGQPGLIHTQIHFRFSPRPGWDPAPLRVPICSAASSTANTRSRSAAPRLCWWARWRMLTQASIPASSSKRWRKSSQRRKCPPPRRRPPRRGIVELLSQTSSHARERTTTYQSLREAAGGGNPSHCPLRLLFDAWNGLDGVEQPGLLLGFADVSVDQQAIGLRVYVLHGDLEAVEAPCLGQLHLG